MFMEKEFNLLHEPWIRVLTRDLKVKEVGLKEFFTHINEYRRLAGECATQDMAMMRLLLAFSLTIFYRYNAQGVRDSLVDDFTSEADALDRWEEYKKIGKFPEKAIEEYCREYEDRFYLFHPMTPFYQVPGEDGTLSDIKSLCGDVKTSGNKDTQELYTMSSAKHREALSYAETTRWLIHYMCYSPSVKPAGVSNKRLKSLPGSEVSTKQALLGKFGVFLIEERNLFDMIMINLCALKNGQDLWGEPNPAWERDPSPYHSQVVPQPDNLAEAYTIQTRRVHLVKENGKVVRFYTYLGECYTLDKTASPAYEFDPMIRWIQTKRSKKGKAVYSPVQTSSHVTLWKEFETLVSAGSEKRNPGLIMWYRLLENCGLTDPTNCLTFWSVGMGYKQAYIYDREFESRVTVESSMISEKSSAWQTMIQEASRQCTISSLIIKDFAKNAAPVIWGESTKHWGNVQEDYYNCLDPFFKEWISDINPETCTPDEAREQWGEIGKRETEKFLRELVSPVTKVFFESTKKVIVGEKAYPLPRYYDFMKFKAKKAIWSEEKEGKN